ncbi:MAG: PEP-CTERM sorting domain-containing protein [Planctomycetota bacterium]
MQSKILVAAASAALFTVGTASAQIIQSSEGGTEIPGGVDFEFSGYAYGFAGHGAVPPDSGNVEANDQVTPTFAFDGNDFRGTLDTSTFMRPDGSGYDYVGLGTAALVILDQGTDPGEGGDFDLTGTASDYTVSFDFSVSGGWGDANVQFFRIDLKAEGDTGTVFYSSQFAPEPTGSVTINIGDGDAAAFNANVADIEEVQVIVQMNTNLGVTGSDADNLVILDNVVFSGPAAFTAAPPIPEPASLGLLGVAGLGLLRRRK